MEVFGEEAVRCDGGGSVFKQCVRSLLILGCVAKLLTTCGNFWELFQCLRMSHKLSLSHCVDF